MVCCPKWAEQIPDDQWSIYRRVIRGVREHGVEFAIGGGFAMSVYTGHFRNTKDLDIYVVPEDREAVISVLSRAGLSDYYEKLPYVRSWIYRGNLDATIVDVIWSMANHRADVDADWLTKGCELNIRGEILRSLAIEELLWAKLYVVQRDRSDWPDVINLLYAAGANLDWERLLERLGGDLPLLTGALAIFGWTCPGRARSVPDWIWDRAGLDRPAHGDAPEKDQRRLNLLDMRPWLLSTEDGIGC